MKASRLLFLLAIAVPALAQDPAVLFVDAATNAPSGAPARYRSLKLFRSRYSPEEYGELRAAREAEERADRAPLRETFREVPRERSYLREEPAAEYTAPRERRVRPAETTENKVVNIHATTQLQVVVFHPERFGEETRNIADELLRMHTVVLNLERTDREQARRIVDFLSGVAYSNGGKIKRIATDTFIITPYNVDLMGDNVLDELENSGVYF